MTPTPIDISEEEGIRYLHFGSEWIQGAMRIRRPIDLQLEYTRHMLFGLLLHPAPWPARILLIGLGAGSLTKFCYWRLPQADVTTVEIDAGVWAVARHMFKLPEEDARLHMEIADGVDFLQSSGPQYDYILIDGYDAKARATGLESTSFYTACRTRLSAEGILAANLFGRSRKYTGPFGRLTEVFDGHALALPPCESGNVVAVAGTAASALPDASVLRTRALALKKTTGLDLLDVIKHMKTTAG